MPSSSGSASLLLSGSQGGDRVGCCNRSEIILFTQAAINVARNGRGRRALYAPSISTKQYRERNFRMSFISVSQEPADARRSDVIVASSGLTKRCFIPAVIKARFASAIKHRRHHAL